MTDLTKIEKPFGLLDAETQEALRAHGGPYEVVGFDGWQDTTPAWELPFTYRVKPQPPKPREWWLVRDRQDEWRTVLDVRPPDGIWQEVIHAREVLPE